MSNFCGRCGNGLIWGDRFCQRCGNQSNGNNTNPFRNNQNNNNNSFSGPIFPQPQQPRGVVFVQQPHFVMGGLRQPIFVTNGAILNPTINGNHQSRGNCMGGCSVHVNCVSCMKLGL